MKGGKRKEERERDTERKFVLLNILGWPKVYSRTKGRKKERNCFKHIWLAKMFVQKRKERRRKKKEKILLNILDCP